MRVPIAVCFLLLSTQVHKSMAVVVQKDLPYIRCGVRSMQKTQGLTGIVLDIDEVDRV